MLKVVALEAVPAAARVFQHSVEQNQLSNIIQVMNVAAGLGGTICLRSKPMSSNSFTVEEADLYVIFINIRYLSHSISHLSSCVALRISDESMDESI